MNILFQEANTGGALISVFFLCLSLLIITHGGATPHHGVYTGGVNTHQFEGSKPSELPHHFPNNKQGEY